MQKFLLSFNGQVLTKKWKYLERQGIHNKKGIHGSDSTTSSSHAALVVVEIKYILRLSTAEQLEC